MFFVAKFFSDNLRNTSLNQLYLKILKSKPNRGAFMYTPLVKHSEMTPKVTFMYYVSTCEGKDLEKIFAYFQYVYCT